MSGVRIAEELEAERDVAAEASRRGRSSKRKGKAWERAVASKLRAIYGDSVKRGWQSRAGTEQCDVEGSPWWVEAKACARVNLRAAMRQAIADTDGRPPIVVAKDDREEPVVVMRLRDWLELAREADVAPWPEGE